MRDDVSPRRRPVSMYGGASLSSHGPSPCRPSSATAGGPSPTPPRLKRLSLVAARDGGGGGGPSPRPQRRTPTFAGGADASGATLTGDTDTDTPRAPRSPARHVAGDSTSSTDTTASSRASTDSTHSTRASPLLSPTPRRVLGRSSISYSPSTWRPGAGAAPGAGAPGVPVSSGVGEAEAGTAGLTLAERHADLLRTIAMRERRVNELRQELATQEEALRALRRRWTAIARADAMAAPPAPRRGSEVVAAGGEATETARAGATTVNAATSPVATKTPGSTPTPMPKSPDPATQGLWHALAADADETIQEGKRFWGQLLRTVGAAAGGSVPGGETGVRGAGGGASADTASDDKLDLSRILPALGLAPALPGSRRTPSPATGSGAATEGTGQVAAAAVAADAKGASGVRLRRAALSPRPRPLTGPSVDASRGDAECDAEEGMKRRGSGEVEPKAGGSGGDESERGLERSRHGGERGREGGGGDGGDGGGDGQTIPDCTTRPAPPPSPSPTTPLSPRPPVTAVLDSMGW